jgi:hypothetical protein
MSYDFGVSFAYYGHCDRHTISFPCAISSGTFPSAGHRAFLHYSSPGRRALLHGYYRNTSDTKDNVGHYELRKELIFLHDRANDLRPRSVMLVKQVAANVTENMLFWSDSAVTDSLADGFSGPESANGTVKKAKQVSESGQCSEEDTKHNRKK